MKSKLSLSIILIVTSLSCLADPIQVPQEDKLYEHAQKLDKISFLPNMLPIIIENRDFIGLTDAQVNALKEWRAQNQKPMFATMEEIARKRIEIMEHALAPNVSAARLQQMQNHIFRLQRKVLEYKLSCREHVVKTFTDENWNSFYMILADRELGVSMPEVYAGNY